MSSSARKYPERVAEGRSGRGSRLAIASLIGIVAIAGLGACVHMMHRFGHNDVQPPAAEDFGYGPRTSGGGIYVARVEPLEPVRVGRLHGWRLEIRNGSDQAVDGAQIVVDGGMPQHGHGLPTKPRVTRALGAGAYEVQGMRFNMGGWWVVTFRIATAAGEDSVTFHLSL